MVPDMSMSFQPHSMSFRPFNIAEGKYIISHIQPLGWKSCRTEYSDASLPFVISFPSNFSSASHPVSCAMLVDQGSKLRYTMHIVLQVEISSAFPAGIGAESAKLDATPNELLIKLLQVLQESAAPKPQFPNSKGEDPCTVSMIRKSSEQHKQLVSQIIYSMCVRLFPNVNIDSPYRWSSRSIRGWKSHSECVRRDGQSYWATTVSFFIL